MSKQTRQLKTFGPWALVTGASSGIGAEFARQLAEKGLNIVLVARRRQLLDGLCQDLERDHGIRTRSVALDLSESGSVAELANAVADLDIGAVISNAGTGFPARFLELEPDRLHYHLQLNARSHLDIAHHFGRRLAERGRGGLLFGGAMGAEHGIPFMANDAGAKAYVQSLARSLHLELKPAGIHVTVMIVPPTDTAIIDKFGLDRDKMPMKPMPVGQCVSESLAAFEKNRSVCLPGAKNRIMRSLVPSALARVMMGKMIEKTLLLNKAAPEPSGKPVSQA
ncbi:SDR family NAD(P)-dependent oxidoreductase [Roseibium sp. M-1]